MSAKQKRLVGLTGGIGSGKSSVARVLAQCGATVVDADAVSRSLTAPGGQAIDAIRLAFGATVIDDLGALNRGAMRELVFAQPSARHTLESIIHPLVAQGIQSAIEAAPVGNVVLDIPLLVESGKWRQVLESVIVVDCRESTQIARVGTRNGLPPEAVKAIIHAQVSRPKRLAAADFVIFNDDIGLDALEQTVRMLARRLGI